MYDVMLTVRIKQETKKLIDKELKTNRRFLNQSELVKRVLELYLTDSSVKSLIHKKIALGISEKWLDGENQ